MPDDADILLGMMDSEELAHTVCANHNYAIRYHELDLLVPVDAT